MDLFSPTDPTQLTVNYNPQTGTINPTAPTSTSPKLPDLGLRIGPTGTVLQFYKYNDTPEVWDNNGTHYSSWDSLLKANGGQAPNIQTISRPARAANEFPVGAGLTPTQTQEAYNTIATPSGVPSSTPFSQNPIKAGVQSLAGIPRAFVRATAETGLSAAQAILPKSTPNSTLTINPTNKIQAAIFGTDPLEPLANKIANLQVNGGLKLPLAAALVIGSTAADLLPFGAPGGEQLAKEVVAHVAEQEAAGATKEVIVKSVAEKLGQDVADRVAQKIGAKVPAKAQTFFKDTTNKVDFSITGTTEKQRVESAIVNSERIKNELSIRGKEAAAIGQKLSPADLKLAESYEQGVNITDLAKQAQDPAKFTKFVTKMADYYDFRLAADRAAGGETKLVSNYIPHNWDLSNPEDLARFNEFAKQKGLKPYEGFRSQPRVFDTYAQGEAQGFKRANPNILEDLKKDYVGAGNGISKQVLKQGLQEAAPGKVNPRGLGFTDKGKPFVNSNIQGLEGISYHPSIAQRLKGYESLTNQDVFTLMKDKGFKFDKPSTYNTAWDAMKEGGVLNTVGTLYDRSSRAMKHMLLNFSGFHSLNVSANYAGASIFTNPLKGIRGLAESVPSFFSESVTQKVVDGFKNKLVNGQDFSVFDAGLRAGVNMDRALPAAGKARLNPLTSLSRAMFDRELYTLKLNLVDQVFASGKVLPESVEGRNLGKEINLIMGEVNGHVMNMNPNTQKWFSRILLAPQFTESKYITIAKAATSNPTKSIALKSVVGKSIVIGTLATFGTLLATGKFPGLKQILLNFSINPSTQTNITNPKGQKQDITYPQSFVSEPARPIGGIISGFRGKGFDDLTQYGKARLAPLASDLLQAYTGKDYYGNPIVNPKSPQSPGEQYAKNLGIADLPIGVQAGVNKLLGKQTTAQAGINILGLKTRISASDSLSAYYDAVAKLADTKAAAVRKVQPIYDQVQKLKDEGNDYQAQQIVDGLSDADYAVYKTIKASGTRTDTLQAEAKLYKTYQQVQALKAQGNETEAQSIIDAMSDEDYHAYTLLKKRFNP